MNIYYIFRYVYYYVLICLLAVEASRSQEAAARRRGEAAGRRGEADAAILGPGAEVPGHSRAAQVARRQQVRSGMAGQARRSLRIILLLLSQFAVFRNLAMFFIFLQEFGHFLQNVCNMLHVLQEF